MKLKVVAVVVTFFPDAMTTHSNLDRVREQVEAVIVVDNGSPAYLVAELRGSVSGEISWLSLSENEGVARAQNLGIDWALGQEASHVVFFDQDSAPAPGAVSLLLGAALDLERQGVNVGHVSPIIVDDNHSKGVPFFRDRGGRPEWLLGGDDDVVFDIDTAISSGSLMPRSALEVIGGMNEALFIDLVDIDWCFRARHRGFRNFCVSKAHLMHQLGGRPERVFGREIGRHSPVRNYYYFRNAVWLFGQEYVPGSWKRAVAYQLLKRYVVYPLALPPRRQYLTKMTQGILHGILGRLGRLGPICQKPGATPQPIYDYKAVMTLRKPDEPPGSC